MFYLFTKSQRPIIRITTCKYMNQLNELEKRAIS